MESAPRRLLSGLFELLMSMLAHVRLSSFKRDGNKTGKGQSSGWSEGGVVPIDGRASKTAGSLPPPCAAKKDLSRQGRQCLQAVSAGAMKHSRWR